MRKLELEDADSELTMTHKYANRILERNFEGWTHYQIDEFEVDGTTLRTALALLIRSLGKNNKVRVSQKHVDPIRKKYLPATAPAKSLCAVNAEDTFTWKSIGGDFQSKHNSGACNKTVLNC